MKFKRIVGMVLIIVLSIGMFAGCEKKGSADDATKNVIDEPESVSIEETTVSKLELSDIDDPVMRKVTIDGVSGYVGYTPIDVISEWKVTNEDGELIDVEKVKAKALECGKEGNFFFCEYNGVDLQMVAREGVVDYVKVIFDEERNGESPIFFTDYNIAVGQSEDVLEVLGEPQFMISYEDENLYFWHIYNDRKVDYELVVYTWDGVIEQIEMGVGLHVTNPEPEYVPNEDVVLNAEDLTPFKLGAAKGNLMTTPIEDVSERFIWDYIEPEHESYQGYSDGESISVLGESGIIRTVMASGPVADEILKDVRIDTDLELSVTAYDIAVGQPAEVLKKLGKPDECTFAHNTKYLYTWNRDNGMYMYTLIIITENGVITTVWSKTGDLE